MLKPTKPKVIFPNDPIMQSLYERVEAETGPISDAVITSPEGYFSNLIESIIGQQLSDKAATKILAKVKTVLEEITPKRVAEVDTEVLRAAGPSYSKITYMKNVADAWLSGAIDYQRFPERDPEEIILLLTQIKGVGRWTAEMFLMSTLAHPDVFSTGDYGLKKAIIREYSLPENIKPKELLKVSDKWAPNRSLASRILWRSLSIK